VSGGQKVGGRVELIGSELCELMVFVVVKHVQLLVSSKCELERDLFIEFDQGELMLKNEAGLCQELKMEVFVVPLVPEVVQQLVHAWEAGRLQNFL
jgi:hypothetical protein